MTLESVFRVVFALFFILNLGLRYYFHWKRGILAKAWGKEGFLHYGFKRLLILLSVLLAFSIVIGASWTKSFEMWMPDSIRLLALLLVIVSTPMHYLAFSTLGKSYQPVVEESPDQKLVTHGIYAYIRHPIYSASLLGIFGAAILADNYLLLLLFLLAAALVLLFRVPREEKVLIEQFGNSYKDYCQKTGALLPKWKTPCAMRPRK